MATVKGYLQLKKKSALKDSWHTYLCEYSAKKRILTVKSKDGNFVFWEKEVDKAWPLEARANRRQNRFDVLSTDGVTAAFAAPKEADMAHWLEVFASKPEPLPTSPKLRFKAAAAEAIRKPEEIGDFEQETKDLEEEEATQATGDWVAGPFDQENEQFEIAGDEADDSTINSYSSPKNEVRKSGPARTQRAQTSPNIATVEEEQGILGHVVRWLSSDNNQGPGVLVEAPTRVSIADVEKEAELEQKDLEEEEEKSGSNEEEDDVKFEQTGEEQTKRNYKDITELLVTHHLGQFVLNFHKHGVDSIKELKGCTDAFLTEQVGMKKAHILKFRRALKDADIVPEVATYSVYEAADGFRGTYEDVLAHEQKLGLLDNGKKYKLYEAPDGFRGTYEEVLAHETMLAKLNEKPEDKRYKLYEAPDGFRGSYEDVLAHERRILGNDDPVIIRIYEAPDGFRGTYEEVLEHEKKLQNGLSGDDEDDKVLFRLYEAPDGFRGSYEEVLAHEEKLGHMGEGGGGQDVLFRLYEAPDGFRGSYEEVLAHEREMGLDTDNGGEAVIFSLYEAPDGFRGTYEEVLEHEKKHGLTDDSGNPNRNEVGVGHEPVLFRVYEAPDGFRGSYEEVIAHEKKHGLVGGGDEDEEDVNDPIIYRVYEASDGFRGFYDEVLAHEKKHGLVSNGVEDIVEEKKYKLYEAPDGFRGSYEAVLEHEREIALNGGHSHQPIDKATHIFESPDGFKGLYDEVLAHEKEMGFIEQSSKEIFVENPKLLLRAVQNFQRQVAELQAKVAELEGEAAKVKKSQIENFQDFTSNL
jgi:hypothetical protein